MKSIKSIFIFASLFLASCATTPESITKPKISDTTLEQGSIILCKFSGNISSLETRTAGDAISILFGSGRSMMSYYSFHFMESKNEKLVPIFHSDQTSRPKCGLVNLPIGNHIISRQYAKLLENDWKAYLHEYRSNIRYA